MTSQVTGLRDRFRMRTFNSAVLKNHKMNFGLKSDGLMGELSNYLDIALGVVREGVSVFTKNISKYNQLEKNIERDKDVNKLLKELSWNVIRIWECEISDKKLEDLISIIRKS